MPDRRKEPRTIPRPFSLHWGGGQIVEEAQAASPYHQAAIQLLRFDDGSQSLRFCYYDRKGRFQRSPLIVSEDLIPALRASLRASPRLSRLLKRVVG